MFCIVNHQLLDFLQKKKNEINQIRVVIVCLFLVEFFWVCNIIIIIIPSGLIYDDDDDDDIYYCFFLLFPNGKLNCHKEGGL